MIHYFLLLRYGYKNNGKGKFKTTKSANFVAGESSNSQQRVTTEAVSSDKQDQFSLSKDQYEAIMGLLASVSTNNHSSNHITSSWVNLSGISPLSSSVCGF